MNNDWTDILRDKLAEYEMTPPEGLWQEIDEAIIPKPPRKRLGWIAVAAVCAVLLSLSVFIRLGMNVEDKISESPVFVENPLQEDETAPDLTNETENAVDKTTYPILLAKNKTTKRAEKKVIMAEGNISEEKTPKLVAENISETKDAGLEKKTELPETEPKHTEKNPLQIDNALLTQTDIGYAESYRKNKRTERLSLNLHAANLSFSSANNDDEIRLCSPSSAFDASILDSIFVLHTTPKETIESKHHRPLRLGISLSYPFTERLSLTSGINFSHLASEITHSSKSYKFTDKQKLTYIGIPIGTTYRIFDYKAISLYLAAGGMVEKCVSGEEKRPQFSTFAGGGLQVALGRYLSLYAEPRVSHYFDNNSDVINIYKDEPTAFDFNFGIKVNLQSK